MNDGLIDGFRHNAWATRVLLETCADLTPAQRSRTVEGTQGTIIQTLWHLISADAGYCTRLTGIEPAWDRKASSPPSIAELAAMNDDLEQRWLAYFETPFNAEQIFVIQWVGNEVRDVPAGIILMQALHHGNEHRSQIATVLTQIGIEPPGWGLWEFAEESGRAPIHQD